MDLRESILKLEGHPHCPTKVYLDLEQGVVQPYLDTGGAPREAHEGRWVWVCTAPARVVPSSLVSGVLRVEPQLQAHIEAYRQGIDITGDYGDFEFQTYIKPADWFKPFIVDLIRYYEQGLTPEQVLERESLECEAGAVEFEEALHWLRDQWAEWDDV